MAARRSRIPARSKWSNLPPRTIIRTSFEPSSGVRGLGRRTIFGFCSASCSSPSLSLFRICASSPPSASNFCCRTSISICRFSRSSSKTVTFFSTARSRSHLVSRVRNSFFTRFNSSRVTSWGFFNSSNRLRTCSSFSTISSIIATVTSGKSARIRFAALETFTWVTMSTTMSTPTTFVMVSRRESRFPWPEPPLRLRRAISVP